MRLVLCETVSFAAITARALRYRTPRLQSRFLGTMTVDSPSQELTWPSARVRETFLNYFKERGHTFVPSSPTVPHDDPTLLFANAGMNQFKSIFLGTVDPASDFGKLRRATNSQKCIRAGGKHNDLEDVGKDSYHHTMFEMLGNWSFGDYFKKEAVAYSWDLLTNVYALSPERLYATYFGGDKSLNLEPDLETKAYWEQVGCLPDHILPGDVKDNFWEMGDQGPCGPCSEIHYDRIGGRNASSLVNQDDPNVLEIWNNVFIQYNREKDGTLKILPNQHVDTGLGFERLVSILQNKFSNYDTDVFQTLFKKIQELTGARAYTGNFGEADVDGLDTAYRVVADHVRTLTFAITDGGVPNNEGRGYVLRRILRRGSRFVRKKFKVEIGTFFSRLAPTLIDQMGDMFPEITQNFADVKDILDEEEESFSKTLDRGEKLFEQYLEVAKTKGLVVVDGNFAWRLKDTFGFPPDLTRLMAEENGFKIDEQSYNEAEACAKLISKAGKAGEIMKDLLKLSVHDLDVLSKNLAISFTDDSAKYGHDNINATVQAIYTIGGFASSTAICQEGDQIGLLLDRTNFYAEQGGQEYDTGNIVVDGKFEFMVENVQLYGGYVLHTGYVKYGTIRVGDQVTCQYDELRRWPIRNNHSGTHLLNLGLREVFGEGLEQRGSLVAAEKLRFDFSYKSSISLKELALLEIICNELIRKDLVVYAEDVPLDIAKSIKGVRAVFGETYPDPVRVVSVGISISDLLSSPDSSEWEKYSIEFCGGTHVVRTSDIKELVLLEEGAIAKGIRRIVAITGEEARKANNLADFWFQRLADLGKLPPSAKRDQTLKAIVKEIPTIAIAAVKKAELREQLATIIKAVNDSEKARFRAEEHIAIEQIRKHFTEHPEAKAYVGNVTGISANLKVLLGALNAFKTKHIPDRSIYLFATEEFPEPKVAHALYLPKSTSTNIPNAQEICATTATIVGGNSGGKGESSQGIGTNIEKLKDAMEVARQKLENLST